MGGKSSEQQTQTQTATPYGPAAGQINSLLGQVGGLGGAPDRTGMVNDAFSGLQSGLAPTIGGQFLDPNSNPFFASTASGIADMATDRVKDLYAGSGRDPVGAGSFAGNVGTAVTDALAPMFANQYNAERGNQLNAIGSLFQGGGATAGLLSGLDQVPLQELLAKLQGVGGIGSAFGTQTGTGTKESNMSPVDQFYKFSSGLGNLFGGKKG